MPRAEPELPSPEPEGGEDDAAGLAGARRWLALALLALVLAGLFALAVVVGRMPPLDRWVTDPLFFKRCLVAHVNLALVTWFYAFAAALLMLLPGRGRPGPLVRGAPFLAGAGIAMLLLGAGIPEARPILSNYIPTIDHWLFQAGQVAFAVGVLASLCDRALWSGRGAGPLAWPPAVSHGLRGVAAALLIAASTFAVTWWNQPAGVAPDVYYELLVWGGGHVLQLVCTLGMISCWMLLLGSALGQAPVSGGGAAALFLALLAPWGLAPLLPLAGSWSSAYRSGFTWLMQWGLFPVTGVFLLLCLRALHRARRAGRLGAGALTDPRVSAFLVSGGLTLLGFALGAAIRGSNTVVPAHYHAAVGGVTVAFMAATLVVLPAFGLALPAGRVRRAAGWQPALYGAGMLLFAAGFALAGAYGMGRKVYGAEQAARGAAETLGLTLMGIGGLVAIAGGLLFLGVVAIAWWRGARTNARREVPLAAREWRWRYGAQRPG